MKPRRTIAQLEDELESRTAERDDALAREAAFAAERDEALAQQRATAEVLGVINSSPGDLAPVFDAILEKAHILCGAVQGAMYLCDGDHFYAVAQRGHNEPFAARLRQGFRGSETPTSRPLISGDRFVHIPDLGQLEHPFARAGVELAGTRTLLSVPLRKGDALLGMVVAARREARPFSEKEIALLENFAAQAVIAMENARLITETREALEQQTATAEVLAVINSSPGDLAPVFDAMLRNALRLCGADLGNLLTFDGECFEAVTGIYGARGVGERELSRGRFRAAPGGLLQRLVAGETFIHTDDVRSESAYQSNTAFRNLIDGGGYQSITHVALRKKDHLLGAIVIFFKDHGRLTDKQITLLQNFAAQAVIAMENARLITETREALDQQTATAEVLQVINSSPGDLAPVFEMILQKAHSLCGVDYGSLQLYDGESFRAVAVHDLPDSLAAQLREGYRPRPGLPNWALLEGESYAQVLDIAVVDDPIARRTAENGIRTLLWVALRKDEALLGSIAAARREVQPFTDKQIALLQNFAAQAVIAMESARLLSEIRQRQAELRATFDNMADGVAMFDARLRLAAWNRNFQQMLQLPDAFLAEPKTFDDFIRYLTERGEFGETDSAAQIGRLKARLGDHYSFERTRPDGTVIEVRNNPMPDGGVVVIYGDITERKRSEEEIRAARDAAEAALRDLQAAQARLIQAEKMASLGQLTAGVAHEIKNPLNFVNNFAGLSVELLDDLKETAAPGLDALDADKRSEVDETIELLTSNLDKIAEHGKRADNIVKSMLEHSRGVAGERRQVDLNALVEEALNLAYHGARAQDQSFNITLQRDYDGGLAMVELAPQEMTRVFLNLIGNGFYAATKRLRTAGPGFRPTLTVATRELGDAVEVRVRDNGTGIPPDIRDKLFQPFFTTKPTGEGTGLGLSISYDIVTQLHGGTIEVDSQVGSFTAFVVRLPRRRSGAAAGRAA